MFSGLRRTVQPLVEPVSLSEAKTYLRVDHGDEDALISSHIASARSDCEEITKRALLEQTWTITAQSICGLELPRPPLLSVVSVEYRDTAGALQPFTDYHVDLYEEPCVLRLTGSSPSTNGAKDAWKVVYKAGYGSDADDVPLDIKNATLLKVKAQYEKEEKTSHLHHAAESILNRHRLPFIV